ncbi:uncharacterized protein N7482_000104 [Penicillium canariense]|uniref:HTH APSES-type domain-containing protein n=1 Tax=Penicillium canariense TaxID=189055 RepID=A0A9W9LST9_9EURO|nr:uncharacterized protein N7482_000104 [Penicillium canariense]KAJ5174227.1 hypothetical protein N7482_000104 [Penicillium canariense]
MGSIRDLLNPLPGVTSGLFGPIMSSIRPATSSPTSSERPRRSKIAKDGAVFRPGPVQGELRYPPCEQRDQLLEEEHRKADLKPFGNIAEFPRHIPYQSDKKSFHEKTGRDSFHVFQYTFQRKGVDVEPWTITWDYNIGLVRTTHLFKCMGYSKTTPGKVLNSNTGLREISHSITGGALAAQGYWMPFEAAKAVATTFCWEIRYLLTPLFGTDFPGMCIPPSDRGRFARMVIDPAILNRAAETAHYYRSLERLERPLSHDNVSTSSCHSQDPGNKGGYPTQQVPPHPQMPPKLQRRSYADSISSARGSSSEPYCGSPQSPTYRGFLPINRPPSSHPTPRSPYDFLKEATELRKSGLLEKNDGSDSETDLSLTPCSDLRQTSIFPPLYEGERVSADTESEINESDISSSGEGSMSDNVDDEEYCETGSKSLPSIELTHGKPKPKKNSSRSAKVKNGERTPASGHFAKEVKAAHALLHLHMQRASFKDADGDETMGEPILGPLFGCLVPEDRKRRRASL